jgi:predicted permease
LNFMSRRVVTAVVPHELRYALRMIRLHPWFSAAIVATLALGIGTNTAIFTLVNAVLFKPLPFQGGDRIVAIFRTNAQGEGRIPISYPDYLEYRAQASTLEFLEASQNAQATFSERGGTPAPHSMARVTYGFFDMLGVRPALGRGLRADDAEAGGDGVVLISDSVWRDRFGRSPDVVGRPVVVAGEPATVIGVMPQGFGFPNTQQLWTPIVDTPELHDRSQASLMLVGVRKPGVSIGEARADLAVIAARLAAEFPSDSAAGPFAAGSGLLVSTFHDLQNGGPIRLVFLLMQGAVGFVLLIACANVANMMLSRALGRTREMSVRAALGAARWRMMRQLLVEAMLLAFIGGTIGLAISVFAVRAFDAAVVGTGKPSWVLFEMDYAVFAYFAAACLASGLLFGLVPALRASRVDLGDSLKEGARDSGSRHMGLLSGALVVVQFALALVLLAGAGLFVRGMLEQRASVRDLPLDEVLVARVALPADRYPDDEARFRFYDRLLSDLRETPGLRRAALASNLPGEGTLAVPYQVEGQPEVEPGARPRALRVAISPEYLPAIDVPIVAGRAFDDRDGFTGRESIIVTSEFAARVWPGEPPLGRRIRFYPFAPPPNQGAGLVLAPGGDAPPAEPGPWLTVVGVSGDLDQMPSERNPLPVLFAPYAPGGSAFMSVVLRAGGDPGALATPLRAAVRNLDPDRALDDVMTLGERMRRQTWYLRVFGTMFVVFAAGAILMAAVGIYGVVAQATGRRTREIGIRMALGATSRAILGLVIARGVKQLAIGVVLGLGIALAVTRLMGELLFAVSPSDPAVFGSVIALITLAGMSACCLPARRATRLDPVRALREE